VGNVSPTRRRAIRSYRDLEVYKRSKALLKPVYALSLTLPDYERYGLADQLRRAARSVPANIAEGYAKRASPSEFKRYLAIAVGSTTEMEVHLEIAFDLGYITQEQYDSLARQYEVLSRQIYTLIERWRDLRPPTSALRPQN
jgi:four helix bundle protein